MINKKITILNYGSGNLLSVKRAFEHCGARVNVSNNVKDVINAERLVIPGVGAFRSGIEAIKKMDLYEAILNYHYNGRPLLGICLGMQLLSSESSEFGINQGLNLIPGKVKKINTKSINNTYLKIPHIGWAEIEFIYSEEKNYYYMCHSYEFLPNDSHHIFGFCIYGGHKIVAAVKKDNVLGYQFHPEKSGNKGLNLLEKFMNI